MEFAMLYKDDTTLFTNEGSFYIARKVTGSWGLYYLVKGANGAVTICVYKNKEIAQKALRKIAFKLNAFELPYEGNVVAWL